MLRARFGCPFLGLGSMRPHRHSHIETRSRIDRPRAQKTPRPIYILNVPAGVLVLPHLKEKGMVNGVLPVT